MSQSTAKVAAIFPTYNRKDLALECIRRLLAQTLLPWKILIVGNACTDGTEAAISKEFGGLERLEVIANEHNVGAAGGYAMAMRRALALGAEFIWLLDDDGWPEPDALKALIEANLGPQTVACSLLLDVNDRRLVFPMVLREQSGRTRVVREKEGLPTSLYEIRGEYQGALIPAAVINVAGVMDGRFYLRGEDEEYMHRIGAAGFRFMCVPESIILHPRPELRGVRLAGKWFFYDAGLPLWKAYCAVRNNTYCKARIPTPSVLRGIAFLMLSMLFGVLYDDRKASRMAVYLQAGIDGLSGRLGPPKWR